MNTVCIDLGNTRMKAALFENGELKESLVLEGDGVEMTKEIIDLHKPERSILSSVIHHSPDIETVLTERTQFHKLSHQSKLNFTIPVGKPETMGADRLALAAAVVHNFPRKNNMVVGLGSCITYNFINKYSEFLGGGISPGLEMRLNSLHDYTAILPVIKKDWNFPLVGYDTRTNILSGVIYGMAKEIEGTISAYEEKYSNFNVVLTGGDCTYFARLLKNKIFADPDLLYKGLYAISETNN
jgi:type III pantothenate kinase